MRATGLLMAMVMLTSAGTLAAQDAHVVDDAALRAALETTTDQDRADRERVQALLDREEVREVAGRYGFDISRLSSAVATLTGADLARVADRARQVEDSLVGGQVVSISTTTIILALLVLIVLILVL